MPNAAGGNALGIVLLLHSGGAALSVCPCCGLPAASQTLPCGRCLQKPPPWQRLVAVSDYALPLSMLVHQFKFVRRPEMAKALARLLLLAVINAAERRCGRNPICLSAYRFIGIASGAEDITKVTCSVVALATGWLSL
jgi:hypothetical protein